jgi:glutamate-1-semialdehyde 2,1-aminomutase
MKRHGLSWERALALAVAEEIHFVDSNPHSQALAARAAKHMLFGVPLHWMKDSSTPFSLTVVEAAGARFSDADDHVYVDFCLGDGGAMFGHAPRPVARAISKQTTRGYTTMLPSEDAVWVCDELARRFGLPYWQFALSASDANRFVLRWLRAATGRHKVLVFNGCYHGAVDDAYVDLVGGVPGQRDSLLGQVYDLTRYTKVIEFNDLHALEMALAGNDVACVLAEPVMTNIGMVLPQPGYWHAAQDIIRRHGSLLVVDETHTISSAPGGYARAHGMTPDALVVGKPVASGLPCAVYGFTEAVARRIEHARSNAPAGHSGVGTTLTANMLTMTALRASLADVMTGPAYETMFAMADRLALGLRRIVAKFGLPWCVTQVGARTQFQFAPAPPLNGRQAAAGLDKHLSRIIHLFMLNRGFLITPFHNALLVCPETDEDDVDRFLEAFDECVMSMI